MTIRYIKNSDIELLESLDKKCFPPPVRYNRYALNYYLSLPNSFGLSEFVNGKLLGFIIITLLSKDCANVVTIDVEPKVRRHGIGSKLMSRARDILISQKINKITLQVSVDNTPAVIFYQKHGFKIVGRLPMYYPTTDGYQMEWEIC